MTEPPSKDATRDAALPISPSLGPALDAARMPHRARLVEPRVLFICALAIGLGVAAAEIAQL